MYKVKLNSDGTLERFKVRLVIQGNHQRHGIDYLETFSPVIKMQTIRSIITLAACKQWTLHQLDINNAFLHGDLEEEVYMKVPQGMSNPDNKSLYGLKQASRQWFAKLSHALQQHGFKQSKNDYSLFTLRNGSQLTIVAVYMDDMLITGLDPIAIQQLKTYLHDVFTIKDLGRMHYFLGLEVNYVPEGIILCQRKFTRELLEDADMT